MHKGLEKYWLEERKYYKRDLKAGHVAPEDLKTFWDDKVEYRSHEYDPKATFAEYKSFVLADSRTDAKKKSPKKKAAKKKAKKTKRKSSWWPW